MLSQIMPTTIKGQVTLPKNFRNLLSLKAKESVLVSYDNSRIVISKVPSLQDCVGLLKTNKSFTDNELETKLTKNRYKALKKEYKT